MEEQGENNTEDNKPTYEELQEKLKEKDVQIEKISSDYKSVEQQRNQLESGIKGIGLEIERKGLGKVDMYGNELKIEFNQPQQQGQQKSEIDLLQEKKADLKRKYDNDLIDTEDYYEQIGAVSGDIAALKRIEAYNNKQEQDSIAKKQKLTYIEQTLKNEEGVFVASSDYVKALPDSIAKWIPRALYSLGTDGFGRSGSRAALRNFFEVDFRHIIYATLGALVKEGKMNNNVLSKAEKDLKIKSDKLNPMIS